MRSGCSSFVVVCNLFVARVLWPNLHLAYRAKRCFRRLDPRFVKAAAVRSSGPGESSVTEKPKGLHFPSESISIDSPRTMEMLPPAPSVVVDSPLADEEDADDQSVTSAAFGIESSATSFTEHDPEDRRLEVALVAAQIDKCDEFRRFLEDFFLRVRSY